MGFYTLLASVLAGPEGRVFSFEPLPANLTFLREHLRLNEVKNVTVVEVAVADRHGVLRFHQRPNRPMSQILTTEELLVKSVALEELIAHEGLPAPQLIKVDVEGAEALVLKGGAELLRTSHPTIFLATHGPRFHAECCHLLRSFGY